MVSGMQRGHRDRLSPKLGEKSSAFPTLLVTGKKESFFHRTGLVYDPPERAVDRNLLLPREQGLTL